jgi:hypothetical protein
MKVPIHPLPLCGHAMWVSHVGIPCWHAMWVSHVGMPCGQAMWAFHVGMLCGYVGPRTFIVVVGCVTISSHARLHL